MRPTLPKYLVMFMASFVGAALFVIGAMGSVQAAAVVAAAAAPTAKPALVQCDLGNSIEQLSLLKDETADAPKTELKLRKDLLLATINCAIADIDVTRTALTDLTTHNDQQANFRDAYLKDLQTARDYYANEANITTKLATIWATRGVAQDIATWRKNRFGSIYSSEAGQFVTLVQNDDLLAAADSRLAQIQKLVAPLKLIDGDQITTLLGDAHASLDKAHAEQQRSNALLRQSPRSAPEDILNHSKASLDALSQTYDTFFGISTAAKKVLGK